MPSRLSTKCARSTISSSSSRITTRAGNPASSASPHRQAACLRSGDPLAETAAIEARPQPAALDNVHPFSLFHVSIPTRHRSTPQRRMSLPEAVPPASSGCPVTGSVPRSVPGPPPAPPPRGASGLPAARERPRRPSRSATPPADTPNVSMAARVSPPPAIENPALAATASARRAVPAANARCSKTPTGPFQMIVPASPTIRARCPALSGPMSRIMSAGPTSPGRLHYPRRIRGELRRDHHVAGEHDLEPFRGGPGEKRRRERDPLAVDERGPDREPRRGEKGVGDPPAHDQPIDLAGRGSPAARSCPPPWRPPPPRRRGGPAGGGPARARRAPPRGAARAGARGMADDPPRWMRGHGGLVPNASITKTSQVAAIRRASASSFSVSPARKRTFSARASSPGAGAAPRPAIPPQPGPAGRDRALPEPRRDRDHGGTRGRTVPPPAGRGGRPRSPPRRPQRACSKVGRDARMRAALATFRGRERNVEVRADQHPPAREIRSRPCARSRGPTAWLRRCRQAHRPPGRSGAPAARRRGGARRRGYARQRGLRLPPRAPPPQALTKATVVSSIRLEKPHSLSYHESTFTWRPPSTLVRGAS